VPAPRVADSVTRPPARHTSARPPTPVRPNTIPELLCPTPLPNARSARLPGRSSFKANRIALADGNEKRLIHASGLRRIIPRHGALAGGGKRIGANKRRQRGGVQGGQSATDPEEGPFVVSVLWRRNRHLAGRIGLQLRAERATRRQRCWKKKGAMLAPRIKTDKGEAFWRTGDSPDSQTVNVRGAGFPAPSPPVTPGERARGEGVDRNAEREC